MSNTSNSTASAENAGDTCATKPSTAPASRLSQQEKRDILNAAWDRVFTRTDTILLAITGLKIVGIKNPDMHKKLAAVMKDLEGTGIEILRDA